MYKTPAVQNKVFYRFYKGFNQLINFKFYFMDTILKNRKLIRSIKKAGKKTKNVFNLYDREGDKINKKPLYIPSGKLFNIVFELGYSFIQNEETQEYEKISIESSNKKKYIKFLKTLFPKLF